MMRRKKKREGEGKTKNYLVSLLSNLLIELASAALVEYSA
jgi:hypothetical protein